MGVKVIDEAGFYGNFMNDTHLSNFCDLLVCDWDSRKQRAATILHRGHCVALLRRSELGKLGSETSNFALIDSLPESEENNHATIILCNSVNTLKTCLLRHFTHKLMLPSQHEINSTAFNMHYTTTNKHSNYNKLH